MSNQQAEKNPVLCSKQILDAFPGRIGLRDCAPISLALII